MTSRTTDHQDATSHHHLAPTWTRAAGSSRARSDTNEQTAQKFSALPEITRRHRNHRDAGARPSLPRFRLLMHSETGPPMECSPPTTTTTAAKPSSRRSPASTRQACAPVKPGRSTRARPHWKCSACATGASGGSSPSGPDREFRVAVLAQQPREFGRDPDCGRDLLRAAHDRISLPTAAARLRA